MTARRSAVAVLAAIALLTAAALPAAAGAHARLLRTSPAQAAEVARAPAQATFLFDEAVRSAGPAELSGGPSKRVLQAPARLERDGRLLAVALPGDLRRGVYTLRWHAVSDDGHRESGALTFGVGVKPVGVPASAAEQTQQDGLLTLARWLFVLGVLAAAGLAGVRLALRPVLAEWASPAEPGRTSRLLAGALVLAGLGAALELASLPGALSTRFGVVTVVAGGVALLAALAASAALAWRAGLPIATALALALLAAPGLAGHALSPGRPRALVLPLDLVHTAAAAAWLGVVLWLGLLAAAAARSGGASVPLGLAGRRGSAVAVAAVAALGVTGVARACLELQRPAQLATTGYGRLLLVKTAVMLALIAIGWWGTRRLMPRLVGRGDGATLARLRRTLGAEALLLVAITAVVALLGSTTPPRSIALAPPAAGPTMVLGRQAGELALGVAARRSGDEVAVEVTVLGPDGGPARGLRTDVAVAGSPPSWSRAAPCGDGRACTSVRSGAQAPTLLVRVRRPSGRTSTVSAALPADPQPARAAALVRGSARALRSQRTLTIDERLEAEPGQVLDTTWRVVAPDRLSYASRGGGDAIVIGDRRWDRTGPGARWHESAQDPLHQPAPDWSTVADPTLLGSRRVDGRAAWLVSFRDPTVPAWFEVAIDRRTQLPLVVRMVAAAHFMVRRYADFDAPLTIEPPSKTG